MRTRYFLAAFLLALLTHTPTSAQTVLRMSNWLPPTHLITTDILEPWARNVEKATNGEVKIQIIPALGKPEAHFDLVEKGIADLAMGVDGYTPGRFKLPDALKLPFLSDDVLATSIAYWRIHERYFSKYKEFGNVKLLGLWTHGPAFLHTSRKEIKSLEDTRGLKTRTPGGVGEKVAVALGVTPVFAPASKSYEMLSTGVVDGIVFNNQSLPAFKIDKILKYTLTVPGGLYRDTHFVIMNTKKWEALSQTQKDAIEKVSGEALATLAGKAWAAGEASATQQMASDGHVFTAASPEMLAEIKKRVDPLTVEWLEAAKEKGANGPEILQAIKDEVRLLEQENAK